MKRQAALLAAVVILLLSAGAVWWTDVKASLIAQEHRNLRSELAEARVREAAADKTRARIEEIETVVSEITDRIEWEPDPTYILRWFADTAEETGVRLAHSQVVPLRMGEDLIGEKKMRRTRYEVRLLGPYAKLVRCLDRVERSKHLMAVETISLAARRKAGDDGEMRLTVSSLCPVGVAAPGGAGVEAVEAGERP